MEELNVDDNLESSAEESETDAREQRFKEDYEAAVKEGCEKSSGSSNESLRRECPDLYNEYRAKVMKHLECLEGVTTQVQVDAFHDNRLSITIRELDGEDEGSSLGHRERVGGQWCDGADIPCDVRDERSAIAQDEEVNGRESSNSIDASSGHMSSNSIDELNRRVSTSSTEEPNEQTSSNSTDESSGPMSSNSTSSVDEEAPEYLARPMYVEINEHACNKNNASVFEKMSPNVTLSNNKETDGQMPDDASIIHEGTEHSDIPSNCEETVAWHLPNHTRSGNEETDEHMSRRLNADADCELLGNEQLVEHFSSSLNDAERHELMPDCVLAADKEIAAYFSSLNNVERYESMADYAQPGNEEMVPGCFSSSQNEADIHMPISDIALTGDEEIFGHLSRSINNSERHESMPACTLTTDKIMVGYLSGPLNNSDVHRSMSDYALTRNKEMIECFSSSLNDADICRPMPDCSSTENKDTSRSMDLDGLESSRDYTSINNHTGGFVPSRNHSLGLTSHYTSLNDKSCGHLSKVNPLGPNHDDVYKPATLDYALTNDKTIGHVPYRSASTVNEKLGAHRGDELRRASLLKREEFGHPAERGVFTDYSKDGGRPQPLGSRSLEDLRHSAPPPVRPPPPKVSFFSFEQELSRCESALREAKAELREERKKQVVVDTFRMNLLEVDRMCSEEMTRLREEAARLERLNKMAAEWERDSRRTFWYDQYHYSREQPRSVGRDCFVKSYVRRVGDPETCQTGEVRPPTI